MGFSYKERDLFLKNCEKEIFELCIIGGGITGAGVFRDASLRGVKSILLEANDFAFGTSSRSTKLIHGGIRYLENFEFHLVFESLSERWILSKIAPHLVKPMKFLLPIFSSSFFTAIKIRIGLIFYDLLALFHSPHFHRAEKSDVEPLLKQDRLKKVFSYYDYWTDDARLTLENIVDGVDHGGCAINYCKVTKVIKEKDLFHIYLDSGLMIRSKKLLNATGPDSDVTRTLISGANSISQLAPTKGCHIVVDAKRFKVEHPLILSVPKDRRVAFVIPWDTCTIIGTTDTFTKEKQSEQYVSKEDANYLLDFANAYFPTLNLKQEDILSSWVGLRPLVKPPENVSAGKVSREEKIWFEPSNCLHMVGGKLTTYRRMAEKILQEFGYDSKLSKTSKMALPGGNDTRYPFGSRFEKIKQIEAEESTLSETLSSRTNIKKSWVVYCIRYESVVHLIDLMVRRLGIYYRFADYGMVEAKVMVEIMRKEMPGANLENEISHYQSWCNFINMYKT